MTEKSLSLPRRVRRRWPPITVLVVLAAGTAIGAGVASSRPATPRSSAGGPPMPPSRSNLDYLLSTSLNGARMSGDAAPHPVFLFGTTLAQWTSVTSGAEHDADKDVYVMVLHGQFVGNFASQPHRTRIPTGRVLTLIYDAGTLETLGWSLADSDVDYTKLGATPLELVP